MFVGNVVLEVHRKTFCHCQVLYKRSAVQRLKLLLLKGSSVVCSLSATGDAWLPLSLALVGVGEFGPPGVKLTGSFRKLGVPYYGVLIIRILLFRVLY